MTSQSLYRKWRSQTFSDLVGQKPIVDTLKNELASGKLSHAYLFTGPRGTGKTSTARLLAKTLNCPNRKDGEPCNECEECREITAGNSFNVIEIDAASNRGIDSIRELREKVMVRPSTGKYKIYILDEAHMLTTEAFNALLKTLEEPPEHAIFVMATTDVHKMLPTVLSRCQRFDFKRITTRQIVGHLQFVAKQEQIELEQGAAELIARAAAGGMRDALSLLDQAIAYSGERISLTQVQTMLGIADPRAIQKFVTHIAQLDSAAGLHLIHELAEAGADLRQINAQVAEYWRGMMLSKAGANIATILDSTEDEVKEITQTATLFALEELTDCARLFAQNDLMQKNQGTPQLGLELALLTAIERHRHTNPSQSAQSSSAASASYARTSSSAASTPPAQTPPPVLYPAPAQPVPVQSSPTPAQQVVSKLVEQDVKTEPIADTKPETVEISGELPEWDSLSYGDDEEEYDDSSSTPATSEQTPSAALDAALDATPDATPEAVPPSLASSFPANISSVVIPTQESESYERVATPLFTLADLKEKWEQIKRRVKTKKEGARIIGPLLNDFAAVAVQGAANEAIIVAQAAHPWHYEQIQQKDYYKVVEWALKIELGQECRIKFLSPEQTVTLPPPPTFSLPYAGESHAPNASLSSTNGSAPPAPPASPAPPALHTSNGSHSPIRQTEQADMQQGQSPTNTSNNSTEAYTNGTQSTAPLARMHTVRENTTSNIGNADASSHSSFAETVHAEEPPEVIEALETWGTGKVAVSTMSAGPVGPVEARETPVAPFIVDESRRARLEQKAKADPIVQKVTEMFKANLKDVRPK